MGWRYFRRLSTTKVVSRKGTASRMSGSTNDTTASVFTAASTAITPISSPSRFAPQSPMKLLAGGKLNTRKPRAAPAVSAASTPGGWRSRSKAITAMVAAMIAHTPAARPSTPSEKFTTFIIATNPMTVRIGPASAGPVLGNASFPTNGRVMAFTPTPKCTTITAASTCPSSFRAGCRSKRSSMAPTSVITAAASSTPCHSSWFSP